MHAAKKYHPFWAVCEWLFFAFATTLHVWRASTASAMMTRHPLRRVNMQQITRRQVSLNELTWKVHFLPVLEVSCQFIVSYALVFIKRRRYRRKDSRQIDRSGCSAAVTSGKTGHLPRNTTPTRSRVQFTHSRSIKTTRCNLKQFPRQRHHCFPTQSKLHITWPVDVTKNLLAKLSQPTRTHERLSLLIPLFLDRQHSHIKQEWFKSLNNFISPLRGRRVIALS
jgi:hypothetical protein